MTATAAPPSPAEIAEARALLDAAPAVDLHADTTLLVPLGYRLGARHDPLVVKNSLFGHVDLPRMAEGGLWAQFFGLVTLPHVFPWGLARRCRRSLDRFAQEIARNKDRVRPCLTGDDVRAARRAGLRAAFIAMEGAHSLEGRMDNFEEFARRGMRYLGLLHFSRNEAGYPAKGLGRDDSKGLTDFGKRLVEACDASGVILDLTHVNRKGFFDALEVAKAPPIVSHTGVSGVTPHWRNLDDEQIRAVAARGGAIGLIFARRFLGGPGIDALVRHILHVVKVGGEDAPALGSDFDGCVVPPAELRDVSHLPRLVAELRRAGLRDEALLKIAGRNALRVLDAVPPRLASATSVDPAHPFEEKTVRD